MLTDKDIKFIAERCHEANKAWCERNADHSQKPWDEAGWEMQDSAIKGVEGILAGNTPEKSHESWMKHRTEHGWIHGDVKDMEAKRHPCLVPYAQLPPEQQAKDHVFHGTVHLWAKVLGHEQTSPEHSAWKEQIAAEVTKWHADQNYIPMFPPPPNNAT